MIDYDKIPPSKQPEATFPWMAQQPPKPLDPGDRPITPKENLLRIFKGEKPAWMPVNLVDSQYCWPDVYAEHAPYEADGPDWFGQEWVFIDVAGGAMPKPGTRIIYDITKWQEQVTFPDLDAVDWEGDGKLQTQRFDPGRAHLFHCTEGIFERLHELMPMDETLVAMYEEPEAVKSFFEAMVPYKIKCLEKVFKYYDPIDYVIYGDDWGTQKHGFFSNEMFREFLMPHTKQVIDYIHATGRFVELHSCGMTQQYIEEIIEMGLDSWNPQPINDLDMLTAKYGEKIALVVDIEGLADAKTEKETREVVRKFVDKYAPRGKVIAGSIDFLVQDEAIRRAAYRELYNYSSEFYAK